jgi:hypothetical protein
MVLFYTALHYIKAYYKSKNINIWETHFEIEKSISPFIPNSPYKVNKTCCSSYKALFRYSHTARYDGVADIATFEQSLKGDHKICLAHIDAVKKYIIGMGIKLS